MEYGWVCSWIKWNEKANDKNWRKKNQMLARARTHTTATNNSFSHRISPIGYVDRDSPFIIPICVCDVRVFYSFTFVFLFGRWVWRKRTVSLCLTKLLSFNHLELYKFFIWPNILRQLVRTLCVRSPNTHVSLYTLQWFSTRKSVSLIFEIR